MSLDDPIPLALTDRSPMPFGKHKGEEMQDVPADYLYWLITDGELSSGPVYDYIMTNLTALRLEHDADWPT